MVDVAVLTVIPPEFFAARDALGIPPGAREKDEAGTISYRGRVRSSLARREYEVLLTCVGRAGNPLSAAAVQDVIVRYRPQAILLMGIAAGMRGKVRIGEVVLSERVVAHEPAALVRTPEGGARTEPRPESRTTPHALHQDVVHYQPDGARLEERFRRGGGVFPVPPDDAARALYQEHVAARISVKTATIAAGEKLLRDPGKLLELRELHGKIEVGEMEAAGLVDACERSRLPWLVIRGISDFGDELKDDRFHDFASRTAATVLADFLAHGLELPARRRQRGRVGAGLALLAASGLGIAVWARQQEPARAQPPPSVAAQPTSAPPASAPLPSQAGGTERPASSASAQPPREEARASSPAPTPPREKTRPRAPEETSRTQAQAPEPVAAPGASAPVRKVKIDTLKVGKGGVAKVGNTKGSESASETEVKSVDCLDNCTVEIGNLETQ